MTASRLKWWRWPLVAALVGLTVACIASYVALAVSGDISANPFDFPLAFLPLVWTLPGLVVLGKARWHPVGWLLVAIGLGYCFDFDLGYLAIWDHVFRIPRPWAAWIVDGWGNYTAFTLTVALLTAFPDGLARQSVRERRWGWARIITAGAMIGVAALGTTVGGYEGNVFPQTYPNPTGLGVVPGQVEAFVVLPIILLVAASLLSIWRRSRAVAEFQRRQYTWVLFPFGALFAMILIAIPLSSFLGDHVWIPVVFMYFIIPIAFSMAIVKYRWFDIDRIVSRAVTYAVVGVVVVAVYSVPVLVFPAVLGLSSDLSVAGATLAAAAVFTPLRRRVQGWVDRRFNRARYDAEWVLAAFSGRLQSAVDLGRVTDELGRAVGITLHPTSVSLWFSDLVGTR